MEHFTEMTRFLSGDYLANAMKGLFKVAAFAHHDDINKFGENTAVDRGAWFAIFPDEAAAVKWLMEGSNKALEATSSKGDAPQS